VAISLWHFGAPGVCHVMLTLSVHGSSISRSRRGFYLRRRRGSMYVGATSAVKCVLKGHVRIISTCVSAAMSPFLLTSSRMRSGSGSYSP